MQNKLKGWIAPNSVTKDPNDKILILDPAGHVGLEEIYKEMREEDTGLRPETLTHVVTLYERIVARFLMNGYYVNTGLFMQFPASWDLLKRGVGIRKRTIFMSHFHKIKFCVKRLPRPKLSFKVKRTMSCIS